MYWIDGTPLLSVVDPYRQRLLMQALYEFREDGTPRYNMVLAGRAKKNWKSSDLVLAAFYKLFVAQGERGCDAFIVANDEDQAGDDLVIAKKLLAANSELAAEVTVYQREIRRKDEAGSLKILPAGDVAGMHGKSWSFLGIDEIHGYRDYAVLEALGPDPTRTDALLWITSYASVWGAGSPLFDLKQAGMRGDDPRMLFSWYSGEYSNDPDFADLPPEQRANPSMSSWPEGPAYLEQQRRRLPSRRYRRLHLNLPSLDGGFFDGDVIAKAVVPGLKQLPPRPTERSYTAFVDMSGGSSDDACLAIAHASRRRAVLDLVISQDGGIPFDPRMAVRKFARALREYGQSHVTGDAYAGEIFKRAFAEQGIGYRVSKHSKTEIYELFEPRVNAGEVELLDLPKLQEQLMGLVVRGMNVDHQPGGHDDWANAAAGALVNVRVPRVERPEASLDDEWAGGPMGTSQASIRVITNRSGGPPRSSFVIRR
jgi:hypothetical protein